MTRRVQDLDPLSPVLIGVGISQNDSGSAPGSNPGPFSPPEHPSPLDMMEAAARNAVEDCGANDRAALLGQIALVTATEGNWSYGDPAGEVARRVGMKSARSVRVDIGVPQHTPIAAALRGIRNGEMRAAMILGGEAKATQSALQREGRAVPGTPEAEPGLIDIAPNERWQPSGEIMAAAEVEVGMWSAVEHYACIEAALRHAEGRSVDQQLDLTADLWHRFNLVAQANPRAAFGTPRSKEFLRQAGPGNRPLAFPYAKWHSTQWAVDQAAALLLCSVELAEELGVPRDRWVFPRVALESSFSLSLTKRANMHRWEAMKVLGDAAADHLGHGLNDIDLVELYSCFPSAVQVQQRELGLDPTSTPTVTGGMAFAGGPFNNFTYQATAEMAFRLRQRPEDLALVTTVSGLLTKPALAVWAGRPGSLLVDDLGEQAREATPQREVVDSSVELSPENVQGATIESLTVTCAGDEANAGFVIADLADGRRWIGKTTDGDLLEQAQTSDLIGYPIQIDGDVCSF